MHGRFCQGWLSAAQLKIALYVMVFSTRYGRTIADFSKTVNLKRPEILVYEGTQNKLEFLSWTPEICYFMHINFRGIYVGRCNRELETHKRVL